jgi:hypothetical protein
LFVLDLVPTLGADAVIDMRMVFTPIVAALGAFAVPAEPLLPPSQDAHPLMMPDSGCEW